MMRLVPFFFFSPPVFLCIEVVASMYVQIYIYKWYGEDSLFQCICSDFDKILRVLLEYRKK